MQITDVVIHEKLIDESKAYLKNRKKSSIANKILIRYRLLGASMLGNFSRICEKSGLSLGCILQHAPRRRSNSSGQYSSVLGVLPLVIASITYKFKYINNTAS